MENLPQDEVGSVAAEPREVKPQPMAFTIHFAENKDIASAKSLRESLNRYAIRHIRNSSLPNVDESKTSSGPGAVGVSPVSARKSVVTRRAGYHSEGYFSSDQEEDIRSRSEFFVRKFKNLEKGLRTTNLAQEKKIMAEQNSLIKAKLMTLPDKHEFGDFLNDHNGQYEDFECKQNNPLHVQEAEDLRVTEAANTDDWPGAGTSDEEAEAQFADQVDGEDEAEDCVNDCSNDTVSEAGTYTIERDTPCPEVMRARQDIENVIGILRVGSGQSCTAHGDGDESSFKEASDNEDLSGATSAEAEHTNITPAAATPLLWYNRRQPKLPRSTPTAAIQSACSKRREVLEEELKMRRVEHFKDMELKELKEKVLLEKLKFWKRKNESVD